MSNKPDYNSYTYNYRQQRFTHVSYAFDSAKGAKWSSFPTASGVLPETNDQVKLNDNNELTIQLFDKDHDCGFHVDSVGALYGRMLASLKPDQYRKDAITCNIVGLIAQDNRAVKITDDFADSPSEKATPPNKNLLMPSKEEWMQIWERANGNKY